MRHVVEYDPEVKAWAVVDVRAHVVISYHPTRAAAEVAARAEEQTWPDNPGSDDAWLRTAAVR